MYNIIKELHSGFRYIAVVLIVVAILFAFIGWLGKKEYKNGNRLVNLFAMISLHTQLLIGLVLYFYSPIVKYSVPVSSAGLISQHAFFKYLHIAFMLLAILVLTIGSAKAKRALKASAQYQTILIWYTVALILILIAIPWPFSPFASRPLFR